MATDVVAAPTGVDPDSGLLLVPAGDAGFSVGVALWDDAAATWRTFVQRSLVGAWEQSVVRAAVARGSAKRTLVPVLVQLVPRPDNEYNPKAISVAAPPFLGGTDRERHLGYMYDRNLVSLGGPLRSLAMVSDRPVGAHALIEVEADEEWDEDLDGELDGMLRVRGAKRTYTVMSLRLRLPWWQDLQATTVEYARAVRPDLVLPFIGHWATYTPGAHAGLLGRTGRKEFPVALRVVDGRLVAFYEDLELAVLAPSSRDFFDRTMRRVSELGGEAQGFAEEHGGALKVFVEDDAPV